MSSCDVASAFGFHAVPYLAKFHSVRLSQDILNKVRLVIDCGNNVVCAPGFNMIFASKSLLITPRQGIQVEFTVPAIKTGEIILFLTSHFFTDKSLSIGHALAFVEHFTVSIIDEFFEQTAYFTRWSYGGTC